MYKPHRRRLALGTTLILGAAALASGCASQSAMQYQTEKPQLVMSRYFNGTLDAHGMFQDRKGRVVKRFHVVIDASWNGDAGTLDKHFTYSDGSTSQRVWKLTRIDDHHIKGSAADIVGEASGELYGNTLHWRYVLALPVGNKVYNVNMDDWMFLMDDRVMLNRTAMSKFGIHLGDVTLSFYKRAP